MPKLKNMSEIYNSYIKGVGYADYQLAKNLKAGDELVLKPERTNKYDNNAIRVETKQGVHLGYIAKEDTHIFWHYRKQGVKITTLLTAFNKTNPTWQMLAIASFVAAEAADPDETAAF